MYLFSNPPARLDADITPQCIYEHQKNWPGPESLRLTVVKFTHAHASRNLKRHNKHIHCKEFKAVDSTTLKNFQTDGRNCSKA